MTIPKGKLMPIGGGEDKNEEMVVLARFLDEIGKKDPRIEIITSATSMPREVGNDYKDAFDKLGSRNYDVFDVIDQADANDRKTLARLEKADAVFFTGGDQNRLIETFAKTKFLELLKDRYLNEDFVIAGSSAGCAALPEFMVAGGTTEEALNKGEIQLTGGLGLISGVVFDTHFTERGRFGRLMNIVATNPNLLCLGFAEDTAAVIDRGGITVLGSGVVTIIDGSEISYSNVSKVKKGFPITLERIIIHVLGEGETYLFDRRKIERTEEEDTIEVKEKEGLWIVYNKGDSAVLFSSEEKNLAVKFAEEVADKHNLVVKIRA